MMGSHTWERACKLGLGCKESHTLEVDYKLGFWCRMGSHILEMGCSKRLGCMREYTFGNRMGCCTWEIDYK